MKQMMLYNHELVLAWRSHQAVFTYLMEDVYLRNLLNVKIIPLDLLPSGKIVRVRVRVCVCCCVVGCCGGEAGRSAVY